MFFSKLCLSFYMSFIFIKFIYCDLQSGPDPWDLEINHKINEVEREQDIPPDLRIVPEKKISLVNGSLAGEWFYKRMLAMILQAGQVKKNEDGTVDVSLRMNFDKEKWQLLERFTALNFTLTEDMIRRSLGYIEEAIYKPTIIEKIAWSEYVQSYIVDYQVEITWTFGILAIITAAIWSLNHVSHKHIKLIIIVLLYLYEVFTSYKEAERESLQKFLSAINSCKWYFWSSQCDVPFSDSLIFIKYMNPLKISIRMFSTIITEPMLCINETAKILIHGITDGLWYPLEKIMYPILLFIFIVLYFFFLLMIVCNYILNIPFNFSCLGLLYIRLKQHNRTFHTDVPNEPRNENGDRISGDTLNRILDVCSQALSTAEIKGQSKSKTALPSINHTTPCTIRRSASTGRLPSSSNDIGYLQMENCRTLNKKAKVYDRGDGC